MSSPKTEYPGRRPVPTPPVKPPRAPFVKPPERVFVYRPPKERRDELAWDIFKIYFEDDEFKDPYMLEESISRYMDNAFYMADLFLKKALENA